MYIVSYGDLYVTEPAETGHISIKYTYSENSTFFIDLC